MKGVYEVEKRGSNYAVYNPSGQKIDSFFTYKEAKTRADLLNKEMAQFINNQ